MGDINDGFSKGKPLPNKESGLRNVNVVIDARALGEDVLVTDQAFEIAQPFGR